MWLRLTTTIAIVTHGVGDKDAKEEVVDTVVVATEDVVTDEEVGVMLTSSAIIAVALDTSHTIAHVQAAEHTKPKKTM